MAENVACETAQKFVKLFYDRIDTKRHVLVKKTYMDTATLAWNGNQIQGNGLVSISN